MNNDEDDWLTILDDGLARNPGNAGMLFDRAAALDALGRNDEAESAYHAALQADPRHYPALLQLARLYARQAKYVEAFRVCGVLLERYPDDAAAMANFAYMLYLAQQYEAAKTYYLQANALLPTDDLIHKGLSLVWRALGDEAKAAEHDASASRYVGYAYGQYRGTAKPVRALMVVAASERKASSNFDAVLDDHIFEVIRLVAAEFEPGTPLPEHHILINGIVDAERSHDELLRAHRVVQSAPGPIINRIDRVLASGRVDNAKRLAALPGVRVPLMKAATAADLDPSARRATLDAAGFTYPFLLRAPGFYAGRHFAFITDESALDIALRKMQKADYILIEYIDTRDAAGIYRKFRTLFIDGVLYPLHLALSDRWKVHYFSASMDSSAEFRAIEASFLNDQASFLGPTATAALEAVARVLDLEYAGADFGLDAQGNIVVFEANAGMTLVRPDADPKWDYRRASADNAARAVTAMLRRYAATEY